MIYPCRCSKCRARRTLAKHPDEYKKPRCCPCGGAYRPDLYRMKREHKRTLCHCSAWWFPHRRGSCDAGYLLQRP